MGDGISTENSKLTKMKSKIKSKLKLQRSRKSNSHDFIIKYNHESNSKNTITDIESYDKRRLVFVSLNGLYQSWRQCPSILMYSALLILPLRKKWIYNPTQYRNEISSHFSSHLSIFKEIDAEFIELLKWKDSQNLVFFMLDDHPKYDDDIVAPFWRNFSSQLTDLYDPMTGNKYEPLQFDKDWWLNDYHQIGSKYNVKWKDILHESYFLTMRFKSMQELIYQSNPKSLNPITHYSHHQEINQCSVSFKLNDHSSSSSIEGEIGDEVVIEEEGEWYISSEYDPEDIEYESDTPESPQFVLESVLDSDDEDEDEGGEWFISCDYDPYDIEYDDDIDV